MWGEWATAAGEVWDESHRPLHHPLRGQGPGSNLGPQCLALDTENWWAMDLIIGLPASGKPACKDTFFYYFLFLINLRVPEAHVKGSAASADVAGVHLASTLLLRV